MIKVSTGHHLSPACSKAISGEQMRKMKCFELLERCKDEVFTSWWLTDKINDEAPVCGAKPQTLLKQWGWRKKELIKCRLQQEHSLCDVKTLQNLAPNWLEGKGNYSSIFVNNIARIWGKGPHGKCSLIQSWFYSFDVQCYLLNV